MQRGNDLSDVIELSRTGKRVAKSWHKTKWKKRNRTENSSTNEEVFLLFSVFIYTCSIYLYHGSAGRHKAVFYTHTHTHIPSGYRLLLVASSFDSLSLSFLDTTTTKKNRKESFLLPKERERENRGHARSQWSDLWPNQKVPSLQCYSNTQRDIKFFRVQKKFVGRKERREKKNNERR